MIRKHIFLMISILFLLLTISCFEVPAPEVQIWATNPYGFVVSQFDYTRYDTQYTASPYNVNPTLYYVDPAEAWSDTAHGNPVWIVPHHHYWSDITMDSVTFWVRNGVDAYLHGYYCEFYRGMPVGEDNEFMYQSPKYSDLYLFLKASGKREDTLMISLYYPSIRVREAVKEMYSYPDTSWQTVQVRVHFYGEDAYGDGKDFDVTQDYMIYRSD